MIRLLFPDPDTPVTQTNLPSGISTSMFFKIILFCAVDGQLHSIPISPGAREWNLALSGEELACERILARPDA